MSLFQATFCKILQGVFITPPGLDHRPTIFVSQEDAIFAPFAASREIQTKTINTIF